MNRSEHDRAPEAYNPDADLWESGIGRPGRGEPVDLADSEEYGSDLERWTELQAARMERRAMARQSPDAAEEAVDSQAPD